MPWPLFLFRVRICVRLFPRLFENDDGIAFHIPNAVQIYFSGFAILMSQDSLNSAEWYVVAIH
jgi:hypothetical protein